MKAIQWASLIVLGLSATALILYLQLPSSLFAPDRKETQHHIIVEKIETMGQLQLVNYHFRDIVKHEVIREWLPDPKVLLIADGEASACIDLSVITQDSLSFQGDTLVLHLPAPQICHTKVNHDKSYIYQTEYTLWDNADLVNEAYQAAEAEITKAALQADILQQSKTQAKQLLVPMLSAIRENRPVKLYFTSNTTNIKP